MPTPTPAYTTYTAYAYATYAYATYAYTAYAYATYAYTAYTQLAQPQNRYLGVVKMPTKRQQIAALMANHPRLQVQYFPRGEHSECRSPCWEFREISTRKKTASFTDPDKALAYAQRHHPQ